VLRRHLLAAAIIAAVTTTFVVAGVVVAAVPAAAHPFGPPPTATISASDRTITIDWQATPDDAVAIGELLGLMPEGSTAAYRQESAAQVAPSRQAEAALSASPLLADYLREHITVTQDGTPCAPDVPAPGDFVHQGARILLTCPDPVAEVTLRITMLHSIHSAYRTFAVGADTSPSQSVFTVEAPAHTWRFGAPAGEATTTVPMIVGGGVLLAVVLLWVWRRRRV
jgi:MYXO-CTERM domain-containing protein